MLELSKEGDQVFGRIVAQRRTHLLVGITHVLVGIVLAIFMNYFIRDFPLLLPRPWYDSYWMPLWVAVLIYTVEAAWVSLPMEWIYGLLITAPPYGWQAAVMTDLYFRNRTGVAASEYLTVVLPALLLALSGAFLKPILSKLASRLREGRNRRLTARPDDRP